MLLGIILLLQARKLLQVLYLCIVDPYCKIGEIGVPVKSYRNIRKLLEYFGVQVDKIGDKGRMIWDPTGYVTEEEKDFTKRWFEVVT
jgi:hypothetical protein